MNLTSPFAKYPHVRRAGSFYFLAGQGCRNPEDNSYCGVTLDAEGQIASYDIAAQTNGVFRNLDRALASAGLTMEHLLDVTVFLSDMSDFEAMNQVWNEAFTSIRAPTRTTVAVKQLPGNNFIEMKAVAYCEDK